MALQSTFTRGYNSFSGTDIKATIGTKAIGTLQAISYQVTREKSPIFTMGSPDARGFARGKRAIAGSLIFIQFDVEPLLYELANPNRDPLKFLSDKDDLRPEFNIGSAAEVPVAGATVVPAGQSSNAPGVTAANQEQDVTSAGSDQVAAIPWYPDQIPPFDVILTAANEYGQLAIMKVLGVELMNNGYGVSIDDIVSEHSYTFIATGLVPWQSQGTHPDFKVK
jgi:hypothetical protein